MDNFLSYPATDSQTDRQTQVKTSSRQKW